MNHIFKAIDFAIVFNRRPKLKKEYLKSLESKVISNIEKFLAENLPYDFPDIQEIFEYDGDEIGMSPGVIYITIPDNYLYKKLLPKA